MRLAPAAFARCIVYATVGSHYKSGEFDNMQDSGDLSILDRSLLDRISHYGGEFMAAQPFPHVVIDNFFEADFARALLDAFPSFERGNSVGDDGGPGGKSTMDRLRELGPAYERLDDAVKSRRFLQLIGDITGIPELLYDPWYLGGGTHENRDGMSLDAHVDFNYHPSERWHRRLNLIVYLNPEWEDAWGGNLELFRDPTVDVRPARSVVPIFNRCVVFETSERSWHAFDRIHLPERHRQLTRRSIALYFYTKSRPESETVARHTTLYVNRPLPEKFVDGHVLSRADTADIKQLLEVRDAHIRRLYAENTELRSAQDKGLAGNLLYLAKRAYVRFRR